MAELFTLQNFMTLGMLVLLQIVLGFDNLLYISLESKRVPEDKQSFVRKFGIGLAIFLRIALLFILVRTITYVEDPFWKFDVGDLVEVAHGATEVAHESDHGVPPDAKVGKIISGAISGHSLIVFFGGAFIIYTATKEIMHMLSLHHGEAHDSGGSRSVGTAVFWIVLMNLVFSFDSILSAMALTKVMAVMATAIIISGLLMIYMADHVSEFLQKNRMYEVLGLFVLFIVGIMLVSEGGHLAHLTIFTYPIMPMTKTTFYFTLVVLILIDIVQGRYQKKLLAMQDKSRGGTSHA